MVRLALLCALAITLVYLFQNTSNFLAGGPIFWPALFLFQVCLGTLLPFLPWYRKKHSEKNGRKLKHPGITLHFQKTLSPLSYIWLLGSLSLILDFPILIIVILAVLLVPLTLVCCILIFFYLKDPQRQEVNILTGHE